MSLESRIVDIVECRGSLEYPCSKVQSPYNRTVEPNRGRNGQCIEQDGPRMSISSLQHVGKARLQRAKVKHSQGVFYSHALHKMSIPLLPLQHNNYSQSCHWAAPQEV